MRHFSLGQEFVWMLVRVQFHYTALSLDLFYGGEQEPLQLDLFGVNFRFFNDWTRGAEDSLPIFIIFLVFNDLFSLS